MANRAEPAAGRWLTGIQNLLQQQATPYDDDPFAFAERVVRDRLPDDGGKRWSVVALARQHPSYSRIRRQAMKRFGVDVDLLVDALHILK